MMTRIASLISVAVTLVATPVLADGTDHEKKSLSDAQIADVVKRHADDIRACWERVPAKQRPATASVVLALSIGPKGEVCDETVIGSIDVEAMRCIGDSARTWQFPETDLASDIEYPIALRAR